MGKEAEGKHREAGTFLKDLSSGSPVGISSSPPLRCRSVRQQHIPELRGLGLDSMFLNTYWLLKAQFREHFFQKVDSSPPALFCSHIYCTEIASNLPSQGHPLEYTTPSLLI